MEKLGVLQDSLEPEIMTPILPRSKARKALAKTSTVKKRLNRAVPGCSKCRWLKNGCAACR
eukprot:6417959-Lingulodinium_polyedra.AAC.1